MILEEKKTEMLDKSQKKIRNEEKTPNKINKS